MNRKAIKLMVSSLIVAGCMSIIPQTTIASTLFPSINNLESSASYAHKDEKSKSDDDKKDKHKGFNLFDEGNLKYLSSDQKKALAELKKCKDNGDSFSKEQQETLHSIADSIIKGKLGDEKYKDFKCLMEKKRSNQALTDEENNKLKEYRDILNGSKHTAADILNQFLR